MHYPYFMHDIKKYKEGLDLLAKENKIDTLL